MTIQDFDKAIKMYKLHKEIYKNGSGFISVSCFPDRIHITLKAFMEFFKEDEYNVVDRGKFEGWEAISEYKGIPVFCIMCHSDMLKYEKTKQYLRGEQKNG